jgi:hypothetical protein
MSREERLAIGNGIWMCFKHGKLIDTDEERFTVEMLQKWRVLTERRARLEVELGKPIELSPQQVTDFTFAGNIISLGALGAENVLIGDAIRDSCVEVIWGQEAARSVRDACIELARNAFSHGRAARFSLDIHGRVIEAIDDGQEFDVCGLPTHPSARGGAAAMQHLMEAYGDRLVITNRRLANKNRVTISLVRTLTEVRDATPCTVTLTSQQIYRNELKIEVHESCKTVYFILTPYFSISDVMTLAEALEKRGPDPRQFVFVADDVSLNVRDFFARMLPRHKVIFVSDYRN